MTNKTPIPIDEPAKIADMDINDLRELVSRYHAKGSRTERYLKRTLSLLEDLAAGRVAIVPVEPTEEMAEQGWVGFHCSVKPAPFNQMRDGVQSAIAAAPPYEFGGGE